MLRSLISTTILVLAASSGLAFEEQQIDPNIVGAYKKIAVDEPIVVDAAKFAVKLIDQGKLVRILSAKSQVVAGMNYSIVFESVTSDGKHHQYSAVVYVPLPHTELPMQLSDYQSLGAPAN